MKIQPLIATLALSFCSVAAATPVTIRTTEAFAMRDAITAILKGHLVITPGAKDAAPIITTEPFDITPDALLALGHDKDMLEAALSDLDNLRTDVTNQAGVTGRADDTHDAILKANTAWAAALKKYPTVTVDLDPIPLDGLQLTKNKFTNDDVFGALSALLKK